MTLEEEWDAFIATLDFDSFEYWFAKLDVTEAEVAEHGPSEALKQAIIKRNKEVKNARTNV